MDDRLREIEERVAKASPGPWVVEGTGGIHMDGTRDWYAVRIGNHVIRGLDGKAEADFIAHSREDIPWLIQQVRALTVLANGCPKHPSYRAKRRVNTICETCNAMWEARTALGGQ